MTLRHAFPPPVAFVGSSPRDTNREMAASKAKVRRPAKGKQTREIKEKGSKRAKEREREKENVRYLLFVRRAVFAFKEVLGYDVMCLTVTSMSQVGRSPGKHTYENV